MHIHTKASDGTFSPEETVYEAKNAGIRVMAVTDHDSIKSVSAVMELGIKNDIVCVPAIEASSLFKGNEYHILGYNINLNCTELLDFIKETAAVRYERELAIIAEAMKMFDGLSLDEFAEFAKLEAAGGFATLNYLKYKGKVNDLKDFARCKKLMNLEGKDKFIEASKVISVLKKADAFVILAHPSYHYPQDVMDELTLDEWRKLGINGVECSSPYNAEAFQIQYYKDYCEKHSLLISAGSDCHGSYLSRKIGEPYASDENTTIIEALRDKNELISRLYK